MTIKEATRVDQARVEQLFMTEILKSMVNLVKAEDQIKDIRAGFVALIYEQFNPCTYSGNWFPLFRVLEINPLMRRLKTIQSFSFRG